MTSKELRAKYLNFFKTRNHKVIDPAPLVLEKDPTTLFTSSGMQPLIPYLMGKKHPKGKRLVDSQPSFRAEDMDEVGDNRHTTMFEMLGNWSLGDYFKKEQLKWFWMFLTEELRFDTAKLYVSVFEGNEFVEKDEETLSIWKSLGVVEDHIYFYGVEKNWWSRSGTPDQMPVGEIGGPDSEVFYDFGTPHNSRFGDKCHPNCDCGRFSEIGNSVFIQYKKVGDGQFEKLPQQNVDFGGGLERLVGATFNTPDVFQTDLFIPIIERLEEQTGKKYQKDDNFTNIFRIASDHIKAATFLIKSGILPSNKLQGYVLRRLLRRTAVKLTQVGFDPVLILPKLVDPAIDIYQGTDYFKTGDWDSIRQVIEDELKKFQQTLKKGLKEVEKLQEINGKIAFDLYQTYGFPWELTEELFDKKGQNIDKIQFEEEFEKHRELSRTASAGTFKGGLAGHSEAEIKYHTATHLLHQALRDILGPKVFQNGSNINQERLRFDFSFDRKMTDEEIKQVEDLINQKIKEDLRVDHKTVPIEDARKLGAIGLFDEKYGKDVSIYAVGPNYHLDPGAKDQRDRGGYYSLEFCGGPHVAHTGEIGGVKITKEEAISQGIRRIRAELISVEQTRMLC
ncbi:alanine--tRNA ligase [Candidatus Daviesbacteria bacterium]|nr:alanine--tRNA ligase [Candidatus Daviesbacteria bacterium]